MSDDSECPDLTSASSDEEVSTDTDIPLICEHESNKFGKQARRWLEEKSDRQADNSHAIKILALAPFLYGQATWPDKWLRFACQVGLLPSDREFKVDTLTDEQLKNVELVENALDFLFPHLWKDEVALAVAMSMVEMCNAQETVTDVTRTALKNTQFYNWLKQFHTSGKNGDKTILALLIGLRQYNEHVFKFVAKDVDVAGDFEKMVDEEDKHVEDIKKQGNEEYRQENYVKATSLYQRAIYISAYNHILYGNRAQAYLKYGDYRAAKSDGKRSVTLQPMWDKGWQRYREACKCLGGPLPADLERWEEREKKENAKNKSGSVKSSGVTRQSSIDDSDSSTSRSNGIKLEDKQDGSVAADRKQNVSSETKSKQAPVGKRKPLFDFQVQDPILKKSHSSAPKHKHKTSSTNQRARADAEERKLEKFKSYLIEGSTALQNQSSRTAVHYYQEALDLISKHNIIYFGLDLEKLVVLKFSIGTAHVNTGEDQEILAGIAMFQEIQVTHRAIRFPLVYLGLGRAYFAQNRFSEALSPLQDGLMVVEKLPVTGVFCWPGTQVIIDESKPGQLKVALQSLLDICTQPPTPDAICRHSNCHSHYKLQIYFTDTDFKGFVRVMCFAKCSVEYHVDCWKKMKSSLDGRHSEKEILNGPCFTPDCDAAVWMIYFYNESGKLQKEWTAPLPEKKDKKSSATKMKPSSVSTIEKRRERKQLRKQRKKEQKAREEEEDVAGGKKVENSSGSSSQNEGGAATVPLNPSTSPTKFATVLKKDDSSDDEMYKGVQTSKSRPRKKKDKKKTVLHLAEFVGEDVSEDSIGKTDQHGNPEWKPVEIGTSTGLDDFDLPIGHDSQFPALDPKRPFSVPQSIADDVEAFEGMLPAGFGRLEREVSDVSPSEQSPSGLGQVELVEEEVDPRFTGIKETIFSFFLGILREHGPLHVDDIVIQRELSDFPSEARDIISKAGGIGRFLIQSLQFAMIDDFVCLMPDAVKARQLASMRKKELRELYQSKALGADVRNLEETSNLPPNLNSPGQFPPVRAPSIPPGQFPPVRVPSRPPLHPDTDIYEPNGLTLHSIASTVKVPMNSSSSTDSKASMTSHTLTVNSPSTVRSSPPRDNYPGLTHPRDSNVPPCTLRVPPGLQTPDEPGLMMEFPSAYDVQEGMVKDLDSLSRAICQPYNESVPPEHSTPQVQSHPSSPERLGYTRRFNDSSVVDPRARGDAGPWQSSHSSLWDSTCEPRNGNTGGHEDFIKVDQQKVRAGDATISPDRELTDSPIMTGIPSHTSGVDSTPSAADRFGPVGSRPNSTDTTRTNSPQVVPPTVTRHGPLSLRMLAPGMPMELPPASSINWHAPTPISLGTPPPSAVHEADHSYQQVIRHCDQEFASEIAESVYKSFSKYPNLVSNPHLVQNLVSDITKDFQTSREQSSGMSRPRPGPVWGYGQPIRLDDPPSPVITRDSTTNTDTYEPYADVMLRLDVENKHLQHQLQVALDKNVQLGNVVNMQLKTMEKEHGELQERYQKMEAFLLESTRAHKSEVNQWQQERNSLQEEVKTLQQALDSTKNAHESVVRQLSEQEQALTKLRETARNDREQLIEQRRHLENNVDLLQEKWISEKTRAQDAEVSLLQLKSDVGKQILERSLKDAEMYASQLSQSVKSHSNKNQTVPPALQVLCDSWKATADRIKEMLMQSRAAFEDQMHQIQQGAALNQLPLLQIPRPPPPPDTPMKPALVRGNMPPMFSQVAANAGGGARSLSTPPPGLGQSAKLPGDGTGLPPPGMSRSVEHSRTPPPDGAPLPGSHAVHSTGQEGFTEVRSSHKQAKNSFEKIMDLLIRMFPMYKKAQITQFIQDLRESRNGSLSGMALDEIVQNVAELLQQDQRRKLRQSGMNVNQAGGPKSMSDIDIFEEEEDPCVICHDEMVPKDTIALECQHRFHNQCIRTWLREQSTCPTCRVHALLPDEFPSLG